jgi:periplasmic divalent cation tolerance protein
VPSIRLVLTTLPNAEIAGALARNLVDSGLAACVNILAPCRSIYRWRGDVREDGEIPLFIKTTAELYPALETYLRKQHPYELPEIVALDVVAGLPDYLQWVAQSTSIRSAGSLSGVSAPQS